MSILSHLDRISLDEAFRRLGFSLNRENKMLCPFHAEKTPSFSVHPKRGIWKCFGCGVGGRGIVSFIQRWKGLSFEDAVLYAIEHLGVIIPDEEVERFLKKVKGKRKASELLASIFHKFHNALLHSPRHYEYVVSRIPSSQIGVFGLATEKVLTREEIALLKRAGYYKDSRFVFENRIVAPLFDGSQIVGFVGRCLGACTPKYLNPPNTPLCNREKVFSPRPLPTEAHRLYIVEGVFDAVVILPYFPAVARLTSALTEVQAEEISRRAIQEIVLVADRDSAGINGLWLSAKRLLQMGVVPKILIPPESAKDANDVYLQNPKAFREWLDRSVSLPEAFVALHPDEEELTLARQFEEVVKGAIFPIRRILYRQFFTALKQRSRRKWEFPTRRVITLLGREKMSAVQKIANVLKKGVDCAVKRDIEMIAFYALGEYVDLPCEKDIYALDEIAFIHEVSDVFEKATYAYLLTKRKERGEITENKFKEAIHSLGVSDTFAKYYAIGAKIHEDEKFLTPIKNALAPLLTKA